MKRFLERLAALLLGVMFLTTLFQVLARVVLQVSSVWSEELARFLYVSAVFIGVVPLIRDDELIRVTALTDRLGTRTAAVLRLVTILLTFPFLAVMAWGAWTNMRLNWNTFAPTLDWLSIGYVYLVICAAGALMLWYLAVNFVGLIRVAAGRRAAGPGTQR
ncbi:MAG: TRAP transporter small permease [Candidatus Rokubacteria bacterium]|nr:TRAP transporter small permease [Candidatus Rokubacteria bacterium]